MKVSVDFETRSPVDLKRSGSFVYFEHEHTKILMAAYRIDDGPLQIWTYDQPPPLDLWAAIRAGTYLHAHNAGFETLGFDLLAARCGWPKPDYDRYVDTAATAAAMALPRALGDLGAALGLDVVKDKDGMRLIRKFSIPRKPKGDEPPGLYWNEPEDHPKDFELFKRYCMRDVETEEAAAARMVPLSDDEQRLWLLDQTINRRGIRIDRRSATSALVLAEKARKQLDKEMREVTGGAVPACSQPGKLVAWVQAQGVELTSAAKAEITDLLELDDLPATVRQALLIRQEAAKTSVSKLQAMLDRASADGRVRGSFLFCGAGTRRWSNTGVNFTNMPRPRKVFDEHKPRLDVLFEMIRQEEPELLRLMYPEVHNGEELGRPLHLVSDAIRGFIWAALGHDLLQADYAGIEGVVGAWLAGEHWKVEAMFEIMADPSLPDMYRRLAASILNTTTDVITKKHPMRQGIGKPGELAFSFGGGVMAFVMFAKNYDVKIDPLFEPIWQAVSEERREKAAKRYASVLARGKEGTLTLSRNAWLACELTKVGWRAQNPATQKAWHTLEDAARDAIRSPGTKFSVLDGRITYLVRNGFLWCRLPSGGVLAYGAPRLRDQVWAKVKLEDDSWSDPEVMDRESAEKLERQFKVLIQGNTSPSISALGVDAVTKKWQRSHLYGGLLFENVVQAIARDLLVNGMRKAEAAGYPIIAHVYDEIITEVPRGWGDVKAFEALICELPEWAAGMPLTAGGWRGKRYRKD